MFLHLSAKKSPLTFTQDSFTQKDSTRGQFEWGRALCFSIHGQPGGNDTGTCQTSEGLKLCSPLSRSPDPAEVEQADTMHPGAQLSGFY